ncbi:hypothetical protein [Mesorhizobium shangrilense]|uniref:Lipoprotein n=1 Tax=Mesorhizobium shangrilense TaxID=460060 RepID=A0ABV2DBK0_9HYPH
MEIIATRSIFFFAFCAALSGCAYVSATPVRPGQIIDGIPIPTVKPLLVISGTQVSVLLVPNPNKTYALRFGSFLAKHDFKLDMQSGMIASLTSNQDSTEVAIALVQTIQKAVETGHSLGSAFGGTTPTSDSGRVQVYDIVFDESGNLIGLKPLAFQSDLMKVPASQAAGVGATPKPANQPTQDASGGGGTDPSTPIKKPKG